MEHPRASMEAITSIINHKYFFHLALLGIDQLGPVTINRCLNFFERPEQVFSAKPDTLRLLGMKSKAIKECSEFALALSSDPEHLSVNKIFRQIQLSLEWESINNHHIVSSESEKYPPLLKQIYDSPPLLFIVGECSLLSEKQLAMVGSRRPSKSGLQDARLFARELAQNGLVVCSGLAYGIDTYSHKGALEAEDGKTIAVLAHGLDSIFPKRNRQLAQEIVDRGGALVSEFPVGVAPRPEFFPRRNRIISGLSMGVLVVEAALKSGSLITAYSALDQNREVFAIPGSIHNPVARGCHQLIKQGAKLVENVEDILEDIALESAVVKEAPRAELPSLGELEQKIFSALSHEESNANELSSRLGLGINEISASLTMLELKNLVLEGEQGFVRHPALDQRHFDF